MLDIAIEAANRAGPILEGYFERTTLEREEKDDRSFVTQADREAEAVIIETIQKAHPKHGIVSEESGESGAHKEYVWVIDPLDGTGNFVNGIPIFATSIALLQDGEAVIGVVYNPVTNALYQAERGRGARYNGKPILVSDQEAKDGIVSFGPGKGEKERLSALFSAANNFFKTKRYLGSAALELGFLARGGTEGFLCLGLNTWDYAAGALIVAEAKGCITTLDEKPWNMEENYFAASNGKAHGALIALAGVA